MPSNAATSDSLNIVSTLSNAIALQEGYGASSSNLPTRSNNPGDIGNTGSATQGFSTPEAGFQALDNQVASMFNGTSHVYNPNMTLAQVGQHYAADPNWAAGVASRLGVPPSTTLNQIASGEVPIHAVARPGLSGSSIGNSSPAENASPSQAIYGVNDLDPIAAVPVSGSTISRDQIAGVLAAIEPSLVISAGLDEQPWFSDPAILQTDGPVGSIAAPVTFTVFFSPTDTLPITIKLHASLKSFQRAMQHVVSRKPTRSGFRLTLWGMQPDTISGTGSTGVFMNHLGLTDFLSISDPNSSVAQVVSPSQTESRGSRVFPSLSEGSLRQGAKDAFAELLMLFKMNGTVWYQSPHASGFTGSDSQLGPDAFSPVTGSSSFQNTGRRNDVLTRGGVRLSFRNSVYTGYFTNFTFTEDADTPFSWNFDFSFKVEHTSTVVPIPTLN